MKVFVRHGPPRVDRDVPARDWELADPAAVDAIVPLLPSLECIVTSDERKAIETGERLGRVRVDERLKEVSRPWVDDFAAAVARYLRGEPCDGWEPQEEARERFEQATGEWGSAIYVTHGTVLTLYLSACVAGFDPVSFWRGLTMPDVWLLNDDKLIRVTC